MGVHVTKARLVVVVYPFLSLIQSRNSYLSSHEKQAFKNKVILLDNTFSLINIQDDLDSPHFQLSLPNGANKNIIYNELSIRLFVLLSEGNIIQFIENKKLLFCGYITSRSFVGMGSGNADLLISGGSIEEAIKLQTVYIDTAGRPSDNIVKQNPERVSNSVRGSLTTSISALIGAVREFKSPSAVIKTLINWSIQNLLSHGLYGGKKFSDILGYENTLSKETYTTNFLHVLNFLQDARIGARLNYWELATGFAQEPLYEIFTQYDDTVFLSDTERNAKLTKPSLVFRKTPWYIFTREAVFDNRSIFYKLTPSKIISDNLTSSIQNIITGVHVSLSILDQSTGLLLNPVTYSPSLLERYGQRVMPVYLSGVKFENNKNKNKALKQNLKNLQDMLFKHFVKEPRLISGSLVTHYDPIIRKGMILKLDTSEFHKKATLKLYAPTFYVQGVERRFDCESGEITQTIHVKWGKFAD